MKKCLVCSTSYESGGYKYCSKSCLRIATTNRQSGRDVASIPVLNFHCQYCGELVNRILISRKTKFCSDHCRRQNRYNNVEIPNKINRAHESGAAATGDIIYCKNPECNKTFIKKYARKFCTKSCHSDFLIKSRLTNFRSSVRFVDCEDCRQLFCRKALGTRAVCSTCAAIRKRAVNARKNHKRRASQVLTMTIADLAKRDGARCNICQKKVNLTLSGNAKWGPTIDHLVPVSQGGTNDPDNLALAHRCCNTVRSNREPAQLLLSA